MPDLLAPMLRVDAFLLEFVRSRTLPSILRDAVEYALLGGGKRLRPLLAWWSCHAVGSAGDASLPAGAAVELIHAFSLVHDDLPALDNDDLRRGRPTLHRYAGEAMALLAGDAMLAMAFECLAARAPDPVLCALLSAELAGATAGMIAGQVHDTLGGFPDAMPPRERLLLTHSNKTGALIAASCRMGALCGLHAAGRRAEEILAAPQARSAGVYGTAVGLMFQIVDDLLDVQQSAEHTGKRTGKDKAAGKLTYPGVLGVEASAAEILRLSGVAHGACDELGPEAEGLRELVELLASRTK